MAARWKIIIVLGLLAIGSAWLLNYLAGGKSTTKNALSHEPDYYMENFTTITMEQDGTAKNKLYAEYMAHYPDDNTTELLKPVLEVFQQNKLPIMIIADKGWVTADNEVILLSGNVKLWQDDEAGERKLEVITSDVRILMDQEYAETDKPATLTSKRTIVNSTGVRAYFKENRLELLHNVHGKILPEQID
ncbi:MAG: hypothetical protein HW411_378 [Gammaproteobacteria bacterium]|nr:hypothetical protein [Gammaproteobacteria bacterium]